MMCRYILAAYDPTYQYGGDRYWPWRHERLPIPLLNRFYYEVAAQSLPGNPSDLGPTDIRGGCAALDETWCGWFRFLNGGRDQYGRSERFVILYGFILRAEMRGYDWSGLLTSGLFATLAQTPIPCPMPPSPSLELEYSPTVTVANPELLSRTQRESRISLVGANAIKEASAVCAALSLATTFRAVMQNCNAAADAVIIIGKPLMHEPSVMPKEGGVASRRYSEKSKESELPSSSRGQTYSRSVSGHQEVGHNANGGEIFVHAELNPTRREVKPMLGSRWLFRVYEWIWGKTQWMGLKVFEHSIVLGGIMLLLIGVVLALMLWHCQGHIIKHDFPHEALKKSFLRMIGH